MICVCVCVTAGLYVWYICGRMSVLVYKYVQGHCEYDLLQL